jgi:hypothetical protein
MIDVRILKFPWISILTGELEQSSWNWHLFVFHVCAWWMVYALVHHLHKTTNDKSWWILLFLNHAKFITLNRLWLIWINKPILDGMKWAFNRKIWSNRFKNMSLSCLWRHKLVSTFITHQVLNISHTHYDHWSNFI